MVINFEKMTWLMPTWYVTHKIRKKNKHGVYGTVFTAYPEDSLLACFVPLRMRPFK